MAYLLDTLLAAGLLWLAWQAVTTSALFRAVVLFMVFGLLMSVTWARLGAPDVALAEAVIGAGITGALLLGACKAMLADPGAPDADDGEPAPAMPRVPAAGLALVAGLVLSGLVMTLPEAAGPTLAEVRGALPGHFLENPVSAVLLDLRGWDTLMETVVLLMAFLGARVLFRESELAPLFDPSPAHRLHTQALVTLVTPVILLVALHVLWTGADAPGGAFQAGALLASLAVLHRLTGRLYPSLRTAPPTRVLLVAGPAAFCLFGILSGILGGSPLRYPDSGAYLVALVLEVSMMASIATALTLLFAGRGGLGLGTGR